MCFAVRLFCTVIYLEQSAYLLIVLKIYFTQRGDHVWIMQ